MKIILISPGTGNFYCGNCIRDNALAKGLIRRGHRAVIVPLYLPMLTDEQKAQSDRPIPTFFGGINSYLQQVSWIFRHTPRWLDALLDQPWALRGAAKRAGMTQAKDLGPMTVSMLRGENGRQAKELRRLVEWLKLDEHRPDIVLLSNALLLGLGPAIKRETGAKVFCTLQGEDYFLADLPEPHQSEAWDELRAATAQIDGLIAISEYYGQAFGQRLEPGPGRMLVAHNGITLDDLEPAGAPPATPTLGYFARLCALKGLHHAVEAFIKLRSDPTHDSTRLLIGGTMTPADEPFVAEQKRKLEQAGLADQAEWRPNMSREEKVQFLQGLTLLSVPALYGEAFGLYLIEGLACGAPFVQPSHAAFPELQVASGGGALYDDHTPSGLAAAWKAALAAPDDLRKWREAGLRAARDYFSADAMAERVEAIITQDTNEAAE